MSILHNFWNFTIIILFAVSPLFGFSQQKVDISINKPIYQSGETIKLHFKTSSPFTKKAWIGLFEASVPNGSNRDYETYQYIENKTDAFFEFRVPKKSGNYQFRVLDDDPGKELEALDFQIRDISAKAISLKILTSNIKPSQPFELEVKSSFKMNPQAWVGIFKKGMDRSSASGYDSYVYSQNMKGDSMQMMAPPEIGDYELRFYADDPGALVKSVPFRIGTLELPGIGFSLPKTDFDPEEDIVITYTGHSDLADNAWIGLFRDDAISNDYKGYLSYQYLNPKLGGTVALKAPTNKGDYQVRMFYTDWGPQLLEPKKISVTSTLDKNFIKKEITEKGKVVLYGIYFEIDKSEIKKESYALISQIAEVLKADQNLKIMIEGHTDSQGETTYNQELSEKRANAVKILLTSEYGVNSAQLQSKGYGELKPVGDNKTNIGRAKNRRVELVKL